MKIGFFLPNATFDLPGAPEVGGIETFAFTVGEALQELGHDVVLFGGEPKAGRHHRATSLRLRLFPYVETKSIPDIGTRFQRLVQRLHFGYQCWTPWLEEQLDVALIFKPFDWPVASRWKKKQPGLRVIMSYQGTDFFAGDRWFYGAVDAAFATSAETADLAEARVGQRPAVIPSPVDTAFFTPAEEAADRSNAGALRLIASGRLVGWKGFDRLVPALAAARKAGQDATLRLAGEGPERAKLEGLLEEHGLAGQFQLLGQLDREALRRELREADAYVAPSIGQEAFSLASLEAAATGLPLVLSSRIGLGEFLDKRDMLRFEPEEPESFCAALESCSQRRAELSAPASRQQRHARIAEHFAPATTAQRILDLLTPAA